MQWIRWRIKHRPGPEARLFWALPSSCGATDCKNLQIPRASAVPWGTASLASTIIRHCNDLSWRAFFIIYPLGHELTISSHICDVMSICCALTNCCTAMCQPQVLHKMTLHCPQCDAQHIVWLNAILLYEIVHTNTRKSHWTLLEKLELLHWTWCVRVSWSTKYAFHKFDCSP